MGKNLLVMLDWLHVFRNKIPGDSAYERARDTRRKF